ncbi:DUF3298 and DUF4163 domain-containing protein [Haliscomenobacter sp.]|uniref:DUF3298 and DUF4163 domain-containing protein n=1 Tax=Haliscomenobacter sp. TaxID=2717303 RepID=UPI0035932C5B
MRKLNFSILSALMLALAFSCQNNTTTDVAQVVSVGSLSLSKTEGKGCDQPDSLRTDCATIDLSWPNIDNGSEALKKSVKDWATTYLVGILAPETDLEKAAQASIEEKAAEFIKMQKDFAKEAPDSPMANFTAESKYNVLLNDGKYLTLEIEGYTYTGGAHGSPTAAVATFDVLSGKMLNLDDLVKDKKALEALAEASFRAERADIFEPTDGMEPFNFDENFPFALPQNYGLVSDGLYCHYLAYEVGPYAIGNTQFVIPFEKLGAIAKIKFAATETIVVTCSEKGEMELAGKPMEDFDALKATLQALLAEKLKSGAKEFPSIKTEGCMMGASGEIRSMYEELKAELLKTKE